MSDFDSCCPLCLEELDETDKLFKPCKCGYQMCRFCFNRLMSENARCPACRKSYDPENYSFTPLTPGEIAKKVSEKKQKERQKKQQEAQARKQMSNVRVIQRNLVYITNLSPAAAKEEVLKKHEYFGRFGKILKVVINKNNPYISPQGPSYSAYVTYSKKEDAAGAIQGMDATAIDGRHIKASYGTTKYCTYFLKQIPCTNTECMYLHHWATEEDCFVKEEGKPETSMPPGPPAALPTKCVNPIPTQPRVEEKSLSSSMNSPTLEDSTCLLPGIKNTKAEPPKLNGSANSSQVKPPVKPNPKPPKNDGLLRLSEDYLNYSSNGLLGNAPAGYLPHDQDQNSVWDEKSPRLSASSHVTSSLDKSSIDEWQGESSVNEIQEITESKSKKKKKNKGTTTTTTTTEEEPIVSPSDDHSAEDSNNYTSEEVVNTQDESTLTESKTKSKNKNKKKKKKNAQDENDIAQSVEVQESVEESSEPAPITDEWCEPAEEENISSETYPPEAETTPENTEVLEGSNATSKKSKKKNKKKKAALNQDNTSGTASDTTTIEEVPQEVEVVEAAEPKPAETSIKKGKAAKAKAKAEKTNNEEIATDNQATEEPSDHQPPNKTEVESVPRSSSEKSGKQTKPTKTTAESVQQGGGDKESLLSVASFPPLKQANNKTETKSKVADPSPSSSDSKETQPTDKKKSKQKAQKKAEAELDQVKPKENKLEEKKSGVTQTKPSTISPTSVLPTPNLSASATSSTSAPTAQYLPFGPNKNISKPKEALNPTFPSAYTNTDNRSFGAPSSVQSSSVPVESSSFPFANKQKRKDEKSIEVKKQLEGEAPTQPTSPNCFNFENTTFFNYLLDSPGFTTGEFDKFGLPQKSENKPSLGLTDVKNDPTIKSVLAVTEDDEGEELNDILNFPLDENERTSSSFGFNFQLGEDEADSNSNTIEENIHKPRTQSIEKIEKGSEPSKSNPFSFMGNLGQSDSQDNSTEDWHNTFRALLPNVNITFSSSSNNNNNTKTSFENNFEHSQFLGRTVPPTSNERNRNFPSPYNVWGDFPATQPPPGFQPAQRSEGLLNNAPWPDDQQKQMRAYYNQFQQRSSPSQNNAWSNFPPNSAQPQVQSPPQSQQSTAPKPSQPKPASKPPQFNPPSPFMNHFQNQFGAPFSDFNAPQPKDEYLRMNNPQATKPKVPVPVNTFNSFNSFNGLNMAAFNNAQPNIPPNGLLNHMNMVNNNPNIDPKQKMAPSSRPKPVDPSNKSKTDDLSEDALSTKTPFRDPAAMTGKPHHHENPSNYFGERNFQESNLPFHNPSMGGAYLPPFLATPSPFNSFGSASNTAPSNLPFQSMALGDNQSVPPPPPGIPHPSQPQGFFLNSMLSSLLVKGQNGTVPQPFMYNTNNANAANIGAAANNNVNNTNNSNAKFNNPQVQAQAQGQQHKQGGKNELDSLNQLMFDCNFTNGFLETPADEGDSQAFPPLYKQSNLSKQFSKPVNGFRGDLSASCK